MRNIKVYFAKPLFACLPLLLCDVLANAATQSVSEQIQAFAADGSMSNLDVAKMGVESLWPENPPLYFQSNNQLEAVLETQAKTNSIALQELQVQARQALSRKCPTNSIDSMVACFDAKRQIAMRLFEKFSPSNSNALALAEFLGEVRATMITNYHWAKMVVNVTPPLMPTNNNGMGYFSGMAPYAIADPVARAAYEKAIADNASNIKMNNFQTFTLPEINDAMTPKFWNYVSTLSVKKLITREQAATLTKTAHLTNLNSTRQP